MRLFVKGTAHNAVQIDVHKSVLVCPLIWVNVFGQLTLGHLVVARYAVR